MSSNTQAGDAEPLPTDAPNQPPDHVSGVHQAGRYLPGGDLPGGDRLCRDRQLDRMVRVRTADAAMADDLEREARFLARLEHAGIPAVHDIVRGDGGALLVMRNIEGVTLAAAIADARQGMVRAELASPVSVLRVLAKVCDALSAAHARGVVHRGVRTDIIVIGLHGEVVLSNWTAAMVAHERPATLRYVADLKPTQSHELDDLHTDIRAVGRCLFEALTLQPYPADAKDPAAVLAATDPLRVPQRAVLVIRRALTSDRVNGYRSAEELRSDLDHAASDLDTPGHRPLLRSVRPSRRLLAAAAVVGLVVGGVAAGAVLGKGSVRSDPGWGRPLVAESFDDPSWRNRWQPDGEDRWEQAKGRLVSTGPGKSLLIYRQRLTPPVAIEYTGQILPGTRPCDLSVWWTEREGVLADPAKFGDGARNWQIQAGAFENQFCAIFRNPDAQRMAYNGTQLVPGRDYRFRVEIDGEHMSMAIDGVEVLRYRDRFPTTSGYLALYGYFPGKSFDDVTVWQKNSTGLVPATAMGDALLGFGHYADAATAYARVAEGDSAESQRALFRKGLAERRADRKDASRETWSLLTDPDLSQAADALRLEDLFATGQHDLLLERLQAYWRRNPAGHDELRQQWQQAVARLISVPAAAPELVERYLSVRDQLFRNDAVSSFEATNALFFLERYEDILRHHPDERRAYVRALLCLGRLDEVMQLPWIISGDRAAVQMIRGNFQEYLQTHDATGYPRAFVLCKVGRGQDVPPGDHRVHPALLHLGRPEELLAVRPLPAGMLREGLVAAGRFEEAAGAGLPDVPGTGRDYRAMLMLGRFDEAEAARGIRMPWAHLMHAWTIGDTEAVTRLRAEVTWPRNLALNTGWFAGLVIGPMIDRLNGSAPAVETALRRATKEWSQVFAKRAWFMARAALGEATDDEVLMMPARTEGAAWLALGKALRADLTAKPADALAAYQAYAALPMHQRLLDNNSIDVQVETFVLWRLRALGR